MEAINSWVDCILATIILIGIVEAIVPDGETKKFVFLVTGVIASVVIATPVIKLLSNDFSLQDVFSVDLIEDNFYYIDTLRSTVDKQAEVLEEVFADNVVDEFNELYPEMEIAECEISFSHDSEGKITDINNVMVKSKNDIESEELLKKRVAEVCEVDVEKVRVS